MRRVARATVPVCVALVALGAAAGAQAAGGSLEAHGSAEQVYATGLEPGTATRLLDRRGDVVAKQRAGELGGVVYRNVKPGNGYRLKAGGAQSGRLRVLSDKPAPPNTKVYDQDIPADGYGYLTTRDGTKLAINVHPPTDVSSVIPGLDLPSLPSGAPTPTLIEYAGYGYADPAGPQSGISILANLMGFTVVDVNMRGTGCSGGSFDFFEPLQSLDGYDIVETIARQPWVANGKVGMMGISYGGISQLFTAATNPPSLAAISPLSVIDNTQTTLYPGGILNTGFALNWAKERVHDALPASPDGGQPWAYQRIQEGDDVCADNQDLHPEAVNLLKKVEDNDHYKPKVADPLAPVTFVDKIKTPVFMACQWTDEQTGGHCPTLASRFTGTDRKWFTFTNGTHVDSLAPETFNRWYDFLKIYVAKQAPLSNAALIQGAAPVIYQEAMGIPGVTLPPDPIQAQPTYEGAKEAFEDTDRIRILFDNGAGRPTAGQPYPGYERSFKRFPVPRTKGRSWFLSRKGRLSDARPKRRESSGFRWDSGATSPTNFSGDTGAGGLWQATPDYHWEQRPEGTAVSYLTKPLAADTTVLGAGYVKVFVRSSKPSVDLQATISEVRPDGKETFVQGGWVRGNERKLDRKKSTRLAPVLSLRKRDVKPMPSDRFVPVTIPLYYQGHGYRTGSRIRVTISAPNGDQPIWAFARAKPKRKAKVAISSAKRRPSKLTLPVVPGGVPTALPPCPGLRGEPCRDYQPLVNRPAKP
ncbi:MAG: CocE/NonD family hydrolase [Solirubrobacterales bacterium]